MNISPEQQNASEIYLNILKGSKKMNEIKCPKCGEVFQVDETCYSQIVKQVRDKEFKKELLQREQDYIEKNENNLKFAKMEQEKEYSAKLGEKNEEIAEKKRIIETLKAQIVKNDAETELKVNKAIQEKEKEREKIITEKNEEIYEKNKIIQQLKADLKENENIKQLAVNEAITQKNKEITDHVIEITELKNKLEIKDNEIALSEKNLKENYEKQLKSKDELIEYYKDFKTRQSTKMIGESLEQHCMTEFNTLRMSAFPNAYFEKDNDARTGSKGDFIFRENTDDGIEIISIMFEMKNEMDTTATKHKNEDFFKELDKDRREKNCEYAVLVSLLESDNDLYNNGIVDVSYRYDKMYVVRPQFFIPIITLLRNAAKKTVEYKRELAEIRNREVDVTNFEQNMIDFKEAFGRNYRIASEKFQSAIDEIDKSIDHLEKIKKYLTASENNLRLANNKADDLSIKKLTKNAPSVKKMFDEIKNS